MNRIPRSLFKRLSTSPRHVRFWTGFLAALVVVVIGFAWVSAAIPTWGSTAEEARRSLPGDGIVPDPQTLWNHAVTIQAPPEAVYPWLAQMGDTRGGFYSYTFIENMFMRLGGSRDSYVNASTIHPEWQAPQAGQGIIMSYMAIQEAQPGQYVLAGPTPDMPGVAWTWLWYLEPLGADATRLIVRHRATFPPEVPKGMVDAIFNAGYIMERGMLRGIRDRAEGRTPPAPLEILEVVLWLVALAVGISAAVRFVRVPGRWHPLGVGLEAVVVLFLFTFVQPPIWLRLALLVGLAFSLWIGYHPGRLSALLRRPARAPARSG